MLPKKNRLKKGEVSFLLKKGIRHKSKLFLLTLRGNNKFLNRFCIIIGKKLKLEPMKRNKFRRQIYEILRKNLPAVSVNQTFDIALMPSKETLDKKPSELEKELIYILNNLK